MYGKHFASMYTGSMVGSGAVVFAVWGYVVANARFTDSSVELNPRILATILGEPVEEIERAIGVLCAPDKHSRSQEEEGRRLVLEGPFLYRVVNAKKYQGIRDEDARREYMRDYMKKRRCKQPVNSVNNGKPPLAHVDVEEDVDVDVKNISCANGAQVSDEDEPPVLSDEPEESRVKRASQIELEFEQFWSEYPRKLSRVLAMRAFKTARKKVAYVVIMGGLQRYIAYIERHQKSVEYVKHPSTWLNGECWNEHPDRPRNEPVDLAMLTMIREHGGK